MRHQGYPAVAQDSIFIVFGSGMGPTDTNEYILHRRRSGRAGVFMCGKSERRHVYNSPPVLVALPATVGSPSGNKAASVIAALGVGSEKSNSFTAPGIHQGRINGLGLNLKIVSYK